MTETGHLPLNLKENSCQLGEAIERFSQLERMPASSRKAALDLLGIVNFTIWCREKETEGEAVLAWLRVHPCSQITETGDYLPR